MARTPTYDELLRVVSTIASFIKDGEAIEGDEEHEMSIDDAFETATAAIVMCRDVLDTDATALTPVRAEIPTVNPYT